MPNQQRNVRIAFVALAAMVAAATIMFVAGYHFVSSKVAEVASSPLGQALPFDKDDAQSTPARATPAPSLQGTAAPSAAATPRAPLIVITGKVLAANTSEPVADAEVSLLTPQSIEAMDRPPRAQSTARTAADGTYRIEGREVGSLPYTRQNVFFIRVEANGYASLGSIVEPVVSRQAQRDFHLPAGATLPGHTEDTEGNAVAGASVGSLMMNSMGFGVLQEDPEVFFSSVTQSDEAGRFRLAGFPQNFDLYVPASAVGYPSINAGPFIVGPQDARIVFPRGNCRLFGKVIDTDKRPVADAKLYLFDLGQSRNSGNRSPVLYSARSDASGRYDFTNLPSSSFQLRIERGIDTPVVTDLITLVADEHLERDFILRGAIFVTGRVIDDETGKGMGGIHFGTQPFIDVSSRLGIAVPKEGERRVDVQSASDGQFKVPFNLSVSGIFYGIPDGYRVDGDRSGGIPGYYPIILPDDPTVPLPAVELRLLRGVVLSGRVLMPDGTTPAGGALVAFRDPTRPGGEVSSASMAADGSFRVTVRPSTWGLLYARSDAGFVSLPVDAPERGEVAGIELKLQKFGVVTGLVTDSGGKPAFAVEVIVEARLENGQAPAQFGFDRYTTTESDGTYYLEDIAPVSVRVRVRPGRRDTFSEPAPKEFVLAPGEVKRGVDFKLESGGTLEGVVTDESGLPTPEVNLLARFIGSVGEEEERETVTDLGGHYRLSGLNSGQPISSLQTFHPDYEPKTENGVVLDGQPHDIRLRSLLQVTLRVVEGGSENPVPHFQYRVLQAEVGGDFTLSRSSSPTATIVQDDRGTARLDRLGAGTHRVEVVVLDENDKPADRRGAAEFTVAASDPKDRVIVVQVAPSRTLRGKVVLQKTNAPLAGATVALVAPSTGYFSESKPETDPGFAAAAARTNAAGDFELKGLTPGTRQLRVSTNEPGLRPVRSYSVDVVEGADPEPVTIVMGGGATVFGRVIMPEGQPPLKAEIHFMPITRSYQPRGDGSAQAQTDETGSYRQTNLEPGLYYVRLQPANPEPRFTRTVSREFEGGTETEVSFDFSQQVHLTGAVRYNGGEWPQDLRLRLTAADDPAKPQANLFRRDDGSYETHLDPGIWDLNVSGAGVGGGRAFRRSQRFAVDPQPLEQSLALNVNVVEADAAIDVGDGALAIDGKLSMRQRFEGEITVIDSADINSARRHFTGLLAGEYQASYLSIDEKTFGLSDWTSIGPGKENVLVVFLGPSKRTAIGKWAPDSITDSFASYGWDASAALAGARPGAIEVELDYEGGANAVFIEWVALFANGSEVARDTHVGWTGYLDRGNFYSLPLHDVHPGASYQVKASIRSDGGTDSKGTVYVRIDSK